VTTPAGEDEFTELTDATFPRVDLVGKGANGIPRFLVVKQDANAGLLDAGYVRELIAKTATEEAPVPQATEAGETTLPNGITLKGSAKDIAAFIHAASVRPAPTPADVAKAKNDTADREKKAASGAAMPDGSYPIADRADLGKAIHAVGRGGASHDAIRKHIISRARSLGASSEIPDNWNSDGSLKGDVSKEADVPVAVTKDIMDAAGDGTPLDDGLDGMDPTTPFAAPADEPDLPGDPTDPGSPAWEGIDAATAHKWLAIAARLKNALLLLAEREMLEAASADPGDAENAFSLEDAAAAVDYAIGNLAVFASGEKAEAEIGAECEEMCKALAGFDLAPLGVIEGLTAIRKAGRVLSAANEAKIRDAEKALGEVLASLPSAPPAETVAKEKGAEMPNHTIDLRGRQLAQGPAAETLARPGPVAKAMSAEDQARDVGPVNAGGTTGMGQPRTTGPDAALPGDGPQQDRPGDAPGRQVVKSTLRVAVCDQSGAIVGLTRPEAIVQQVAKADGDGDGKVTMQAVFDENGNLVGIVDPADITPVAGAGGGTASGGDEPQPGPAAAAADMTPQPPAEAGTPADAVGKSADEENVITVTQDVLKSIAQDAARTALEAQGAAHQEVVAKMAADKGELAEELKVVKARLAVVEEHPAAPGVFTNGQVPPTADGRPLPPQGQLRGQDQGRPGQINVAKAMERRKDLYTAPDAQTQNMIAKEMQGDAISALAAIHAAGPAPVRLAPAELAGA
jgi:hypothetical protein